MIEIIIAIIIGILGILINFYIYRKNKSLVLKEKEMILDKVTDIKTTLQSHLDELETDQKRRPMENLDTVGIRQEKIQAMIEILSRLGERLKDIKIK